MTPYVTLGSLNLNCHEFNTRNIFSECAACSTELVTSMILPNSIIRGQVWRKTIVTMI